jgi:hypothetical protein
MMVEGREGERRTDGRRGAGPDASQSCQWFDFVLESSLHWWWAVSNGKEQSYT